MKAGVKAKEATVGDEVSPAKPTKGSTARATRASRALYTGDEAENASITKQSFIGAPRHYRGVALDCARLAEGYPKRVT